MATQNSINHISNPLASTAITVDPGAAGDSYVQFDINTTGEFRIGVDDDAADAFKISQGSALGGTDTFIMTAAGELTMPLQPAVLAYLPNDDADVTGNGTTFTLGSTTALTEIYDQGGDFATDTFTASVTGRYYIHVSLRMEDIAAAMTDGYVEIATSNRTYTGAWISPGAAKNNNNQNGMCLTTIADMDATDTMTATITLSNGVGDTADLGGGVTITWINVALIC